ncbi:MAG: ABC transporter ATP-binding protein [Actinomycetota bacterium]|nr:ABC transporter ATP-binding protein [Actinomycetota bacterium]
MSQADGAPVVLEARGITKRFPGVLANADVDLMLHAGEILCLLGENGAGKSTLMNMVYGLYQPDAGQLRVRGEPVRFTSSADAIAVGIGMVHQHFQLVPVLTVAENVVLGQEPRSGPFLDLATAKRDVAELSRRYGLVIDPDAVVADLSVGAQQRVELIKALYRNADILILDEPTAVLTPGEVTEFFEVVRSLVSQGKSVVFITHKLKEVLAVADSVTVLRGGRVVGNADPRTATEVSLASMMVGRDVSFEVDKQEARPGRPVLVTAGLVVADDRGAVTVDGVDLVARSGEIFGIAGVEGNGQRELVEAIAGMRAPVSGSVAIGGADTAGLSPRRVEALGVGHVPEDRGKHGLVAMFPITDNLVLNRYQRQPFSARGVMQRDAIATHAREQVRAYDIRTPSVDTACGSLSGGNQQKVVVARELSEDLRLLLVSQPTRGLDVGSIEFIHSQIVARRDAGAAVLLVSAELDEILSLSDRIGVLYRGRLVAVMDRADATRDELGLLMAGARGGQRQDVA